MKSLFAQILAWFLGTLVLCLVAFVATSLTLSMNAPGRPNFFPRISEYQLEDARRHYEEGGAEQLDTYLRRLGTFFPADYYLTDARGRDLVDGTDRSALLARAHVPGRPPSPSSGMRRPRFSMAMHLLGLPSGRRPTFVHTSRDGRYRLVVQHKPRGDPWGFVPYYLWILVVMALLCYVLSVHLATPLRSLRRTVERFGEGDLSARTESTRKDEIGVLSRAFDRMAERIETLLSAERRLLQDVSHELRSPLARLGFAVELAKTSPDREESLARIKKDVDRLAVLVAQLLQLTRAEGDPTTRSLEEIPLHEFLRDLVEDCVVEAEARDCHLVLRIEQPSVLRGERELLHRAFENVLRNAIRHAPDGTAIEVSLRLGAECAVVTIRDFGRGVPEDSLEAIFQPFFRVDSDRDRASGGVGLGLSIAQRAIDLHQGRLTARNANPGLLVMIELPCSLDPAVVPC